MSLRIRNSLEREDWNFVRRVCCLTGNSGSPIEVSRWPFFGEQWVGPYERLRPEWTTLAVSSDERLGYLTGCPDSGAFIREKRWLFDLPLYLKASFGLYAPNGDRTRFEARFRAGFNPRSADLGPEDRFPAEATRAVLAEYPAHLHMNLTEAARGKGVGRALVDRYRADLTAVGVRGIHLYCSERPRPFYERVGFRELDRIEFRPGVVVYRLGSRF